MIEYVVMGMVLHKPLTGYDIKKEIEAGIGSFSKSSYGNLYPALKKLTDKGFLTLTEQTQVDRLKKYYMATELGKTAFLEWLTSPLAPGSVTASLLTRIYFFGELSEDTRRQELQKYELHIQQILQQLREMEKQFSMPDIDARYYFEMSTLYYGIMSIQSMIRWLGHIGEQKPLSEIINREESQ